MLTFAAAREITVSTLMRDNDVKFAARCAADVINRPTEFSLPTHMNTHIDGNSVICWIQGFLRLEYSIRSFALLSVIVGLRSRIFLGDFAGSGLGVRFAEQ
ncbi:hypothetical protein TSAR_016753 [Trichomalopsis sarcophagae]|uniref:Uncharacterized protein n=1 Tax=Trichomalopsis sarcophagae TaxID=543379 RepID=A0A232FM89_9HYME|nr:hypothetical protein TSAR_016753 [Trichomalopsis sarcophagae]